MPYKLKCTTDNTFNASKSKVETDKVPDEIILRSVSLGIGVLFAGFFAYVIHKNHTT